MKENGIIRARHVIDGAKGRVYALIGTVSNLIENGVILCDENNPPDSLETVKDKYMIVWACNCRSVMERTEKGFYATEKEAVRIVRDEWKEENGTTV